MSENGAQFENFNKTMKALDNFNEAIVKRVKAKNLIASTKYGLGLLRGFAPLKTGTLWSSLSHYKKNKKVQKTGYSSYGYFTRFYYKVLDFPSARGRAMNPWFINAEEITTPLVIEHFMKGMDKSINIEAGKAYVQSRRTT